MSGCYPLVTAEQLLQLTDTERGLLAQRPVYLALSGGVDSVVLAHALYQLNIPFTAIHINHQLQAQSDTWQAACAEFCDSLGIAFVTQNVTVSEQGNLENNARSARYAAISDIITTGAVVCFAHHMQDGLETLLLQLKRGAGINGVTSLQRQRHICIANTEFIALRPMLGAVKADIERYALQHALTWHDDPSNSDIAFERNFLRHQIIAPMLTRWPDAGEGIARSLATLAEEKTLLLDALDERLEQCLAVDQHSFTIAAWLAQPQPWQAHILRHWLLRDFQLNCSQAQLTHIVQLCHAPQDAKADYRLGQWCIRRFKGQLLVEPLAFPVSGKPQLRHLAQMDHSVPNQALLLHEGGLMLPVPASVQALSELSCAQITLSERIKPHGYAHSKPLKQWCKAMSIPPWQRQPAFLVSSDIQPLAVVTPFFALVLHAQNTHSVEVLFKH
jgi:tRNA(Ile)-lysidine synthase